MQSRYRLKSRKSYTFIYKRGKAVHKGCLTLVYAPSKYGARFGFSAGKNVGNAVIRNKVRRRLKEIVRALVPEISKNENYIIVAKPEAALITFDALRTNMRELFLKAGALKNTSETKT